MTGKRVKDSSFTFAQVAMPAIANPYGNVHGGALLWMVDEAAYAVASRHAGTNVVTASLDHMFFRRPVRVGDVIILEAAIHFAGTTSMEVAVAIRAERAKTGERLEVGSAYVTMVALDDHGRPTPVPPLVLSSAAERRRFREGRRRRAYRLRLSQRRVL